MKIAAHILFWLFYVLAFALNQSFFPAPSDSHLSLFSRLSRGIFVELIQLLPVLLICYSLTLVFLPNYFRNRKKGSLILFTLFTMFLAVLLSRWLLAEVVYPFLYNENPEFEVFDLRRLFYSFLQLSSESMIFMAFYLFVDQTRRAREEEKLRNAKLQMELRYLQSQINPHFLFNTFNSLYAMARKQSDQTASSIAKLAQIFRFMLYKANQAEIPLQTELRIIRDFIDLEKLRFGDKLDVQLEEDLSNESQAIGPLLLLPLVENAFKHGAGESLSKVKVDIQAHLKDHQLTFKVSNSVEIPVVQNTKGIGLKNLRRQLELQYPGRYTLDTFRKDGYFYAILNIQFL